jgi:PAS domain S-box-containing protein
MGFLRNISARARTYGAAGGLGALALSLQWALRPWTGNQLPFIFLIPAVAMAAASLGRGPALTVTAIGVLNTLLFGTSLRDGDAQGVVALMAYLLLSAAIVLYAGRVRVSNARATRAEEHLKLAQEDSGVGVYELDFLTNTALVSPSLRRLLGLPDGDSSIDLDLWLGRLHPDHVAETRRVLEERIARGELRYEREQRIELENGAVRWLLSRVRIDLTPGGELAVARGATVDITERKELEQRLHHAQADLRQQVADMERLHTLSQDLVAAGDDLSTSMQLVLNLVLDFHGSQHGLLTLRKRDEHVFSVCAHQGLDPDLVRRATLVPSDVADIEESLAVHRALGQHAGFRSFHGTPMVGTSGDVMGMISVFSEPRAWSEREMRLDEVCATMAAAVVEREQARAAAADEEQRFSVALDSAAVPFNILAPVRGATGRLADLRWMYVNPAAARLYGREVSDLIGRCVGEIMPETWKTPGLLEHYVAVIDHGEVRQFETQSMYRPDLWMQVIASPLLGSAAVWFADISERKRQEKSREESDRRKDEFLATLAHELRNPLAPIRQSIRIARAATATEDQKRWSHDVIERQVHNMAMLLDDLLDVSRISRGTLLLRKATVELAKVIEAAIEVARPHIQAKCHHLNVELPQTPVTLEIDSLRIAQVIGNILTNAAKYTDPGGRITLRAALEGDALLIRVADTGIGLAPGQMTRLFEMFSQDPSAIGRSQGGLGIGLSLSRSLVRLHGGDIEACSAGIGRGSEFTVRLPLGAVGALSDPNAHAAQSAPAFSLRRILIADDNVDAADSLAELLRLEGHEVHVAYDGEEALAHFQQFQPDAALLDVGMPKLSGLDVARGIRSLPGGKHTVMVAITGWGQTRDRLDALAAGFDHHATKPVDPAQILDLINQGASTPRRS